MLDDLEQSLNSEINSIPAELNNDKQLEDRIRTEFQKDPAVIALVGEMKEAREQADRAKAVARQGTDPARRAAEKQLKKLTDEYEELRKIKEAQLRAQLTKHDDKGRRCQA